mgnify:CR=1 FL=1
MAEQTRRIKLRKDSAADWTSNDPTLGEGEVGIETDTGLFKIGDGTTAWSSLEYKNDKILDNSGNSLVAHDSGDDEIDLAKTLNVAGNPVKALQYILDSAQSSAPENPSAGDLYVDDGTNTGDSNAGIRIYSNGSWEDVASVAELFSGSHDDLTDVSSGDHRTDEQIQDLVNTLLAAGDKLSLTYDDAGNTLTIDTAALDDEEVEDAVSTLITEGNAITTTYDDGANTLTIAVDESAISHDNITGVSASDHHTEPTAGTGITDEGTNQFGLETVENFAQSDLLAVSTPTVNLPDADDLILHRETLGSGLQIKILAAGIAKSDGTTGTTSLELQVYNQTDATSIYSTTGINRGSYSTPLASGGTANEIIVRLSNSTGGAVDCQGFCLAVIE